MYLSPWKIYKIAKIILGRKRMRKLIVGGLMVAAIGGFCIMGNPTTRPNLDMSGSYSQQKEELSKKLIHSAKQKLNSTAQDFIHSTK